MSGKVWMIQEGNPVVYLIPCACCGKGMKEDGALWWDERFTASIGETFCTKACLMNPRPANQQRQADIMSTMAVVYLGLTTGSPHQLIPGLEVVEDNRNR